MKSLENLLKELLDRVGPAEITIGIPRFAALGDFASYEVSYKTRGYDQVFCAKTIRQAADMALEELDNPAEGSLDPSIANWYRVSRMQREVVEQTLHRLHAKHMARAASMNIARAAGVTAEYEIADAYKAALGALVFDDTDNDHHALPTEPLEARIEDPERPTEAQIAATDWVDEGGPNRSKKAAALSDVVQKLKAKNRKNAQRSLNKE